MVFVRDGGKALGFARADRGAAFGLRGIPLGITKRASRWGGGGIPRAPKTP